MNAFAAMVAACAVAVSGAHAWAAPAAKGAAGEAIYRCPDPETGSVLYTNTPCKEGTKLDILPGKADPAAIEKLRRDEEAWHRRQEAREARAAEREMRLAALQPLPMPVYVPPDAAAAYYPAYLPGYPGYGPARPPHGDRFGRPGARPPQGARNVVPAHPRNPALPPR